MAETDIGQWYSNIPFFTKWWFTLTLICTLGANFGVLPVMHMLLDWNFVVYKFQFWRMLGCVFFMGKLGFPFLINVYFLYSYSIRLETGVYDGKPADYFFLLIFNWLVLIILGFIIPLKIIGMPLVISVLYVWCQINRETVVQFWFGTQFKAMYLPWALAAFNVLLGGNGITELIGIFVGHMFFFLKYKYPIDYGGASFVNTPQIMYKYFPNRSGGVSGFGQAPASRRQAPRDEGRHNWGAGNPLGGN
ncbi:hypothetical protein ACHWQZ_G007295 [Mnemiopsis leidyi]